MQGSTPIYILHIISSINNPFEQKSFTMCVNDFMSNYHGQFVKGQWVPKPFDVEHVQYHRSQLDDGYAPPCIIVDVMRYLVDNKLWNEWMSNFDRIMIMKKFMEV